MELIWHNLGEVPWENPLTIVSVQFNVHLIRYAPRPGYLAFASPNRVHCDGEAITFAHLVERYNVEGGINIIAPVKYANHQPAAVPPDDILLKTTLENSLDSYAVVDARVSHYVSPMSVMPGFERGFRDILLIDFCRFEARERL